MTCSPEPLSKLYILWWQTSAETCGRPGCCITTFTAPAHTQATCDAARQWSVCTVSHWPTDIVFVQCSRARAIYLVTLRFTGCSATQDGHHACTHWGCSVSVWLTVCISSRAAWLPVQYLLWWPYYWSCKSISTCCCQLMTPPITCNTVAAPAK